MQTAECLHGRALCSHGEQPLTVLEAGDNCVWEYFCPFIPWLVQGWQKGSEKEIMVPGGGDFLTEGVKKIARRGCNLGRKVKADDHNPLTFPCVSESSWLWPGEEVSSSGGEEVSSLEGQHLVPSMPGQSLEHREQCLMGEEGNGWAGQQLFGDHTEPGV